MKKILTFLIMVALSISVLCIPAYAATSGYCGANLTWTLNYIGTLTISGTGAMYNWSNLSDMAWGSSRSSIKKVVIGNSVTTIGDYAFYDCTSLSSVSIPDSVTTIGHDAFRACTSLTSVSIGNSVTTIGEDAFSRCKSLTSVTIPDSVTTIGDYAFYDCYSLTSVTIPDSVTTIGEDAFYYCDSLATVYYNGTAEEFGDISIGGGSDAFKNAEKIYFAYVTILDKDGNKIVNTTQNMGETVDVSSITVPEGYELKLYKDSAFTEEFDLNTPISENLTLYADKIELNTIEISGAEKADINESITETVRFATDKAAKYFVCTVKFSEALDLTKITGKDFTVAEDFRETVDGYTYLYLTCTYKDGGNMPVKMYLIPFELTFTVTEKANVNDILTVEILEDAVLAGSGTYSFDSIKNASITVNVLVKSISISGADTIDTATQYTVSVNPDNAMDKTVTWSVDDESIATVSADGIVTPLKKGTVTLKATANDGSGVYDEKEITIKVYSYISALSSNIGVWDKAVTDGVTEYTLYVPKTATSVRLTATHDGDFVTADGTKVFISGVAKVLGLSTEKTVLNLTYSENGYDDRSYMVNIIKYEGTKTTVSDNTFTVIPANIENGTRIILALYDGDDFVEMQSAIYNGNALTFTTDKKYTSAKVMAWDNALSPVCAAEDVEMQ